jgi:hypothetical protein
MAALFRRCFSCSVYWSPCMQNPKQLPLYNPTGPATPIAGTFAAVLPCPSFLCIFLPLSASLPPSSYC